MKKAVILSMLTCLTIIICACQKEDSSAEQQLGQQKAELEAREQALDKRMNALDEKLNTLSARVKALAERERSSADTQLAPPDAQPQDVTRDIAQMKAMMGNPAMRGSAKAEKDRLTQERNARRQAGLENQRVSKPKISGMAVLPAAENSPIPSPTVQDSSPTESSEPQ